MKKLFTRAALEPNSTPANKKKKLCSSANVLQTLKATNPIHILVLRILAHN